MAQSDAETAYAAALEEIDRARAKGKTEISFDGPAFHALDRFPPELARLEGLKYASFSGTSVSDLSPLSGHTDLQLLWLNNTRVSDLSALNSLTGLQYLDFSNTRVSDLNALSGLSGLQILELNDTRVSDLRALSGLTGLRSLRLQETSVSDIGSLSSLTDLENLALNETSVSDLSALSDLTGLKFLGLHGTPVSDLTALSRLTGLKSLMLSHSSLGELPVLAGLKELEVLILDGTAVLDLRPLRTLPKLGTGEFQKFTFHDTPATAADAELARLSEIRGVKERARETLAYLNSLPPWPEPYTPAARPDGQSPEPIGAEPEPPTQIPAPLQVKEAENGWREDRPDNTLASHERDLAREGWEALHEVLEYLGDLRPRLSNQMPKMSKVLTRFETALGTRYEDVNPIKLGTHGNRIIRLSTAAGETLAEDDVVELQEFAAAIALFLERFPEWRAYRDPTPEETFSPEAALHLAETVRDLAAALKDRPEMDPAIPASLEEQALAVAEMPEDTVTANGLANSASNVVSAVARSLWKGAKTCGMGVAAFAKTIMEKSAERVGSGLALAALDILANNAALLRALAVSNPQAFGWILEVLKRLGL